MINRVWETYTARHQLVHDHPQRPPIHTPPIIFLFQNLRSQILWCSTKGRSSIIESNPLLDQSKVRDFNVSIAIQQQVFQFQITVHDAFGMQVIEGEKNFRCVETDTIFCEAFFSAYMKEQFTPIHILLQNEGQCDVAFMQSYQHTMTKYKRSSV